MSDELQNGFRQAAEKYQGQQVEYLPAQRPQHDIIAEYDAIKARPVVQYHPLEPTPQQDKTIMRVVAGVSVIVVGSVAGKIFIAGITAIGTAAAAAPMVSGGAVAIIALLLLYRAGANDGGGTSSKQAAGGPVNNIIVINNTYINAGK